MTFIRDLSSISQFGWCGAVDAVDATAVLEGGAGGLGGGNHADLHEVLVVAGGVVL